MRSLEIVGSWDVNKYVCLNIYIHKINTFSIDLTTFWSKGHEILIIALTPNPSPKGRGEFDISIDGEEFDRFCYHI